MPLGWSRVDSWLLGRGGWKWLLLLLWLLQFGLSGVQPDGEAPLLGNSFDPLLSLVLGGEGHRALACVGVLFSVLRGQAS